MTTTTPTPDPWDCSLEDGHYQAVSECCGANQHEHVEAMYGQCNEFTGWECMICEESMNDEVWGVQNHK